MDWKKFDQDAQQNLEELSRYYQVIQDEKGESNIIEFAEYDPTDEIIEAVALKLRSEKGLDREESLKQARKLVQEANAELNKPDAKNRICALIKSMSSDTFAILPFLYGLIQLGTISIPFDPTGTLLISVAALILIKASAESFCDDSN